MSPKFTPGPWGAIGRAAFSGDIFVGLASHPRDIEETPNGKFPATYDESIANARLIAAAPELYEALTGTLGLIEKAQAILEGYLIPDGYDANKAVELLLGLLDGPEQRAIETPARILISRIDGATP